MANPRSPSPENSTPQAPQTAESRLDVSAQILSFEPGLYTVDVLATKVLRGASGMVVPSIRLDPIHPGEPTAPAVAAAQTGRAFVSTLSDMPLIQAGDASAYLRVQGGRASVLLTIYRLSGGMAAPELRIALVQPAAARGPAPAAAAPALASEPLRLTAHIERAGDVSVTGGAWAGQPGARGAIEGFGLVPGEAIAPGDIEYQALLGTDWSTPWVPGGEFCGSRGLSLPLLGVRLRLRGAASDAFMCRYWGSFIGAGEVGPVADGALCSNGGAPLEALRVVLTRRQAAPARTPIAAPQPGPAAPKAKPRPVTPGRPTPGRP